MAVKPGYGEARPGFRHAPHATRAAAAPHKRSKAIAGKITASSTYDGFRPTTRGNRGFEHVQDAGEAADANSAGFGGQLRWHGESAGASSDLIGDRRINETLGRSESIEASVRQPGSEILPPRGESHFHQLARSHSYSGAHGASSQQVAIASSQSLGEHVMGVRDLQSATGRVQRAEEEVPTSRQMAGRRERSSTVSEVL